MAMPNYDPYQSSYETSARYIEYAKEQLKMLFKPGSWFFPISANGDPITNRSYQVKSSWIVSYNGGGVFSFKTIEDITVHPGYIYANRTAAKLTRGPSSSDERYPTYEQLKNRYSPGVLYTPLSVTGQSLIAKVYVSPNWKLVYDEKHSTAFFTDESDTGAVIPGYIWSHFEGVNHYALVRGKIQVQSTESVIVTEEKPLVVERPPLKLISVPFRKL